MKGKITILLCFLYVTNYAQTNQQFLQSDKLKHSIYLGLGTGIYGKYGIIGASMGVKVFPKTLIELNLGVGGWGSKAGISFTGPSFKRKWFPSFGITKNFGAKNVLVNSQISYKGGTTLLDYNQGLNYNDVNVFHLGVQRQWMSKRGNRFVLEMGYSFAMNEPIVSLAVDGITFYNSFIPKEDITFSNQQARIHQIVSPSGIMINLVYQFGIGK